MQRKLPITPARWNPRAPIIGSLEQDNTVDITATRLWSVMRLFFTKVAEVIEAEGAGTRSTIPPTRYAASDSCEHLRLIAKGLP